MYVIIFLSIIVEEMFMKPEILVVALSLLALCAGMVTLFLRAFYKVKFTKALIFKGLSSLCFIALGVICFVTGDYSLPKILILIGLCFGIIGDEILALCPIYPAHDSVHLIGGGVFFIVGHLFYMTAMIISGSISWIALVIAYAIILTLSLLYESKNRFYIGDTRVSLRIYICIVALFAALGVAFFVGRPDIGRLLVALGGLLFVVSDNILFAYKFHDNTRFDRNIALHIAYYLAQLLIACSIALI